MKFQIMLKDPDGYYESVEEAAERRAKQIDGITESEFEAIKVESVRRFNDILRRWFECYEYLTVEVDTEAGTCLVVERKR